MIGCNSKARLYFDSNERAYDGYLKLKEYSKQSIAIDNRYIEYDDTPCVRFEINTGNIEQMHFVHERVLNFAKELEGIYQVVMPIMVEEIATVWIKEKE
jgi:hypothetical protein